MKASELRIGNLTIQGEIKSFFENGVHVGFGKCHIFDNLEPIPLTEEWLLKFGFEKKLNCSNMIYYILAGKCLLEYNLTHNIADIVKKVHLDLFIEIEYVHQLQNLYFALTNEELTYEQQK